MTHIRVHELASELSVSAQQVVLVLEGLGKKVRGPSTVIGISDAAKVRSRLRASRPSDSATATRTAPAVAVPTTRPTAVPDVARVQSLFLPPVAPPVPAAYAANLAASADPFALPGAGPAFAAPPVRGAVPAAGHPAGDRSAAQRRAAPTVTAPRANPPKPAVEPVVVPAEDLAADWRRRGFDQADQELWCGAGIRAQDAALADRCRSTGIAPTDLPRKLSGRTVLQRLRDGESTTSVWARIQEAEQAPRRAGTKLTGRFQLS